MSMRAQDKATDSDQRVRQVLYLGPSPDDDCCVVATVELTCGCQLTRTLSEKRVSTLPEGRPVVIGKMACPTGHPTPDWMHGRSTNGLIARALGRAC